MGDALFAVSYGALWVLVATLLAAVFFLYRHHGRMLLESREGRAHQGPAIDQPLPSVQLRDLRDTPIQLARRDGLPRLIFFASATCQPCHEARAGLSSFTNKYRGEIETVLVCAGTPEEAAAFAVPLPSGVRVVPDERRTATTHLRIANTPFAIIVDGEGIVRGKGMPMTAEAFEWYVERLEAAAEMEAPAARAGGEIEITEPVRHAPAAR